MSLELNDNMTPVCVILAADRGTRMRSKNTHKVCFPIAGRPAIHELWMPTRPGITRFVIVVGAMAVRSSKWLDRVSPEHLCLPI